MVRARPPKKLRRVCRLIFQMIEKNEKTVFPVKPRNPRGLIAMVFEGTQCFILHAGNVSPFTFDDFLQYQALKDRVVLRVPNHETQKTSYIS